MNAEMSSGSESSYDVADGEAPDTDFSRGSSPASQLPPGRRVDTGQQVIDLAAMRAELLGAGGAS